MRMQFVFVLCGITIFLVSSILSAILAYFYSINPTFIFVSLAVEAGIVFVIATIFLRKYHDTVMEVLIKAIGGDYTDDEELKNDALFVEAIRKLKDNDAEMSKKIVISPDTLGQLIAGLESIKDIYNHERGKTDDIRTNNTNVKTFITANLRTFEKIKAIGLEIKNTSKNIDNETRSVLNDAKRQSEMASRGVKAIGKEIQGITELKHSIISSAQVIEELMEMSKRIRSFVTSIVEMTKKTNMLALNASIEAARAGEAGKSFSVVAEEIKNLATNSNTSAEDITQILQEVQKRTAEVIEMIKVTERIEDNIQTFYQTGDIFIDIVKDVKHVEKTISNISSYTDEHFTDSELMFKIISDFYKKTEDYTKVADKINAEVDELDRATSNVCESLDNVLAEIKKLEK